MNYSLKEKTTSVISVYPPFDKHKKFVLSQPYGYWYLIKNHGIIIDTFYIKYDSSVSINISSPTVAIEQNFVKNNISPKIVMPSKIPHYFFINVAKWNNKLIAILDKLGHMAIQVSHKLITKRS